MNLNRRTAEDILVSKESQRFIDYKIGELRHHFKDIHAQIASKLLDDIEDAVTLDRQDKFNIINQASEKMGVLDDLVDYTKYVDKVKQRLPALLKSEVNTLLPSAGLALRKMQRLSEQAERNLLID